MTGARADSRQHAPSSVSEWGGESGSVHWYRGTQLPGSMKMHAPTGRAGVLFEGSRLAWKLSDNYCAWDLIFTGYSFCPPT